MSEQQRAVDAEGSAHARLRSAEAAMRRVLGGLTDLRDGNFRRRLAISGDGLPAELATAFNALAERNQHLVGELHRVSEAAADGRWPVAPVGFTAPADSGWSVAAQSINGLLHSTLAPLEELHRVLTAMTRGDFTQRMPRRAGDVGLPGEFGQLGAEVNALLDQLSLLSREMTRVAVETGHHGRLGGRLQTSGLAGSWREMAESVDELVATVTLQVREATEVVRTAGTGDLGRRMTTAADGEFAELRHQVNTTVDRLSSVHGEIVRVAREISVEGQLGGQVDIAAEPGAWHDLAEAVNGMSRNLAQHVRGLSEVADRVAGGDLGGRVPVDARGEVLVLQNTVNGMIDQLAAFTDEMDRLARELGVQGKLGGQVRVHGLSGAWRDLADDVNTMADNLTAQLRSIGGVATAVGGGDLSKKSTVTARGEVGSLVETINDMVDTLSVFAEQVTQVAREVGTEGKLGGQARVPNVAGTWKDLTDNVNIMARNLTNQVRNISQVTTAVARGDLSRRIDVDASGEILELKTTINTMVGQLSAFAAEVTRVAREVGTEGKLGGQAEVADVSGTWRRLTESVNSLAGNLTSQVRAIAGVATAVTNGDLTQRITVQASGEVAVLKDNINAMIDNLRESTRVNREQDWLKSNFARLSALMKGQQDVRTLARLLLGELAWLLDAPCGVFYLGETDQHDGSPSWREIASHGTTEGRPDRRFRAGESLVGQAAADNRTIVVTGAPGEYPRVSSGLGGAEATHLVVVPVPFEQQVLGVVELAAFHPFGPLQLDLLEQLKETIGVDVNTIVVNSRTESLLAESQHLAAELSQQSEQLQRQQSELRRSNAELEEKAALLASRNADIELKNREIESARQELEERARQLSEASAYKSEFLANMSHELRTPLNSVLLLAKLLADDSEGTLTGEQVELASTIHQAGSELLALINDVLDLSKVEAGRMRLLIEDVAVADLAPHLESLYRPLAEEQGLHFDLLVDADLPGTIRTDHSRLEQILRNLLSNAIKFTEEGSVELRMRRAELAEVGGTALTAAAEPVAFSVRDSGIGIPAEQLQRIFEAFQQVDGTTARRHGGTGLGLSISQELTALLGGELRVHSRHGEGSAFTLYLPAAPEVEPQEQGEAPVPAGAIPQQPAGVAAGDDPTTTWDAVAEGIDPPGPQAEPDAAVRTSPAQFQGETVLIVDDDPRGAEATAALLRRHGLRVLCAESAAAGLAALQREHDVRAVLMDVMLPEMDGNTAIRLVREIPRYRDLLLVAVTAQAREDDRSTSLQAGADEFVPKPVDPEQLVELLTARLGAGTRPAPPEPELPPEDPAAE
ncbi:HAMP domain-containing protein [Salinifilum ghardaiensis]